MPSASRIDRRGYAFAFPALGLPDPAGEWVNIKVGIGTTKEDVIPHLRANAFDAPRRFASEGSALLDVQYEGAVWLVPLCQSQQPAVQKEYFTLKVRRLLAANGPDSSSQRIKLPDGLPMWWIEHPEGIATFHPAAKTSTQPHKIPSEADEDIFWARVLASFEGANSASKSTSSELTFKDWASKLNTTSHSASLGMHEPEERKPRIVEWLHHPNDALRTDWYKSVMMEAALGAFDKSIYVDPDAIGIIMRSTPGEYGTYEVIFEYAFTFVKQSPLPGEDQWKRVPHSAWCTGYELKFVNQMRKVYGQEPLTQEQVGWARPKAEEA